MKFHPLANVFPLIEGDDFTELVRDIDANGLLEPIVVHEGMILDGRNRWRACMELGVEPTFVEWDGECDHPALFVMSKNIQRRHLSASQRSIIVKRHLLPALEEEAEKRRSATLKRGDKPPDPAAVPERGRGESREVAAKAAGVSPRSVSDAKAVDEADPALGDAVASGEKTLGEAKKEIKERKLGVSRVPMPFQTTVKAIIHQNGVPKETAETIVKTAMQLGTSDIERLHALWERGGDYDRKYVKSRLAQIQPPADPRCATLVTVSRELKAAAKEFDDEWSFRLRRLAEEASDVRDAITHWRKSHV